LFFVYFKTLGTKQPDTGKLIFFYFDFDVQIPDGSVVWKIKYYKEPRGKETCYTNKTKEDHWIGHILRKNCFLKQIN